MFCAVGLLCVIPLLEANYAMHLCICLLSVTVRSGHVSRVGGFFQVPNLVSAAPSLLSSPRVPPGELHVSFQTSGKPVSMLVGKRCVALLYIHLQQQSSYLQANSARRARP